MGPVEDGLNISLFDLVVIAVADSRLQEHTDGVREFLDTGVTESWEFVVVMTLSSVFKGGLNAIVEWVWLGAESSCVVDELVLVIDDFLHIRLYS